jgi:hypothetical protein
VSKDTKLFESSEEFTRDTIEEFDDLKDICLDIEDDGYKSIVMKKFRNTSEVEVWMLKPVTLGDITHPLSSLYYNSFSFVKVKEVFERMERYMKSKGWTSKLEYYNVKMTGGYWTEFEGKSAEKHICYRIIFHK